MARFGLQDPFGEDESQQYSQYSPFGRQKTYRGDNNPEAQALQEAINLPAKTPGRAADLDGLPTSSNPGEPVDDDAADRLSGTPGTGTGTSGTTKGWGFTSGTGGKQEFDYTPGSYEGEIADYSGFDDAKIGKDRSIKYVFLDATRGIPPTVENIDAVVARLNAEGIPAKKVGYDKIDFGLGEGPVDVVNQTRGGKWDWMPDAGMAPASAEGDIQSQALSGALSGNMFTNNTQEAGDAYALIKGLLPWLYQQLGISGAVGGK